MLATRKRVDVFLYRHLISNLILFELILDILCYLFRILSRSVHIISSTPKLAIPVFVLEIAVPLENYQATFPFEEPYETGYAHFWRYLYKHMYMVRTYFRFYYIHLFPVAQRSQYFTDFHSVVFIEYFSAILWCSWQTAPRLYQKEFFLHTER